MFVWLSNGWKEPLGVGHRIKILRFLSISEWAGENPKKFSCFVANFSRVSKLVICEYEILMQSAADKRPYLWPISKAWQIVFARELYR